MICWFRTIWAYPCYPLTVWWLCVIVLFFLKRWLLFSKTCWKIIKLIIYLLIKVTWKTEIKIIIFFLFWCFFFIFCLSNVKSWKIKFKVIICRWLILLIIDRKAILILLLISIYILINEVTFLLKLTIHIHKAFIVDMELKFITDLCYFQIVLTNIEIDHE